MLRKVFTLEWILKYMKMYDRSCISLCKISLVKYIYDFMIIWTYYFHWSANMILFVASALYEKDEFNVLFILKNKHQTIKLYWIGRVIYFTLDSYMEHFQTYEKKNKWSLFPYWNDELIIFFVRIAKEETCQNNKSLFS